VAQYGLLIGLALVALATACALLLGAKAAQGVAQFRAEEHESFTRKERP
jgi:hypothetical protein